jgi:hypothetical protein
MIPINSNPLALKIEIIKEYLLYFFTFSPDLINRFQNGFDGFFFLSINSQ